MTTRLYPGAMRRRGIALLLVTLSACDSPARPVPVASVAVTPATATVIVSATHPFAAVAQDAKGVALPDRSITWRSSDATVATVSSTGLVTTLTPGAVTIQATSEGVVGNASLTIRPVPVASVTVTLPSADIVRGAALQATAVLRDAAGNPMTGRMVTWGTSNPAIAAVDGAGLVTAITRGAVTIAASSENQVGSALLTVRGSPAVIATISPATLTPGSTATIRGTGFDNSLGGVSVSIRGVPSALHSATSTQLEVTVPCVVSGPANIVVTNTDATPAVQVHPVAVNQITVPLGQALVLTSSAASSCNELTPTGGPARYLLTVFSNATSQNTVSSFQLAGNPPPAGSAARIAAPATPPGAEPAFVSPFDEQMLRRERAHVAMLERDRQDYVRLMGQMRALPPAARSLRTHATATEVSPGEMRDLFFTFTGGCSDTSRVMRSKAIRIGTRSVIWEDSANVLQSRDRPEYAEFYERIGRIFDQEQYESIRRTFGDPLRRDSVTDNDGKIHMVFSQRVNGTGAAAYVTSCDQFPLTVSRGSNFGQFFYGAVPVTADPNLENINSPDGWFNFMARTVVHEVKHIASLSARVANNASTFEQSWLEEGTARHAEEVWVRASLHHVDWKANTGFGTAATNGLYCDFHSSDATCSANDALRRPSFGMRRQFNEIRSKLVEPWNWSPFGDAANQSGSVFYQTTWSLVRYVIDRYAASDSAFFNALNNATTTGVVNLTSVAGASLDQILGGWGLALFADDYPGLAAPSQDLMFPTWNLRDIYASLNAAPLWSSRWSTPFPISPVPLTFGAFVAPVPLIRGGAHAYFELSGTFDTTQLLSLRANATTSAATNLRLAIARLR